MTETGGPVELALQGAAALGKLRERILKLCAGACRTLDWCVRNLQRGALRVEKLVSSLRFARLARENVERIVLRRRVGNVRGHAGKAACRNECEQRGDGIVIRSEESISCGCSAFRCVEEFAALCIVSEKGAALLCTQHSGGDSTGCRGRKQYNSIEKRRLQEKTGKKCEERQRADHTAYIVYR